MLPPRITKCEAKVCRSTWASCTPELETLRFFRRRLRIPLEFVARSRRSSMRTIRVGDVEKALQHCLVSNTDRCDRLPRHLAHCRIESSPMPCRSRDGACGGPRYLWPKWISAVRTPPRAPHQSMKAGGPRFASYCHRSTFKRRSHDVHRDLSQE